MGESLDHVVVVHGPLCGWFSVYRHFHGCSAKGRSPQQREGGQVHQDQTTCALGLEETSPRSNDWRCSEGGAKDQGSLQEAEGAPCGGVDENMSFAPNFRALETVTWKLRDVSSSKVEFEAHGLWDLRHVLFENIRSPGLNVERILWTLLDVLARSSPSDYHNEHELVLQIKRSSFWIVQIPASLGVLGGLFLWHTLAGRGWLNHSSSEEYFGDPDPLVSTLWNLERGGARATEVGRFWDVCAMFSPDHVLEMLSPRRVMLTDGPCPIVMDDAIYLPQRFRRVCLHRLEDEMIRRGVFG